MSPKHLWALLLIALVPVSGPALAKSEEAPDLPRPDRNYYLYVCAESDDTVSLVRFGPDGLVEEKRIEVGSFPAETEGPHGINISPSGKYWYVSISHGQPFGSIHKFETGSDEWVGDATVGMFPATLDIAKSTGLLYVVNSDFFGDHVPSTISVVETATMTEVDQIDTGTMPHGARLSANGKYLYSVNMMDDELVEVDALRFEIKRRLALSESAGHARHEGHRGHGQTQDGTHGGHAAGPRVEPSWVSKPRDGKLWIAALSGNQIIEVDLTDWAVTRRFDTSKGPYNLAVSPDAKLLVATYKKSDSIGFWNLETGEEITKIKTTRRIPHGVVMSHDGRYSFVSLEGVGGEPGGVEVYDNQVHKRVATLDIGKQAGGLAVWSGKR